MRLVVILLIPLLCIISTRVMCQRSRKIGPEEGTDAIARHAFWRQLLEEQEAIVSTDNNNETLQYQPPPSYEEKPEEEHQPEFNPETSEKLLETSNANNNNNDNNNNNNNNDSNNSSNGNNGGEEKEAVVWTNVETTKIEQEAGKPKYEEGSQITEQSITTNESGFVNGFNTEEKREDEGAKETEEKEKEQPQIEEKAITNDGVQDGSEQKEEKKEEQELIKMEEKKEEQALIQTEEKKEEQEPIKIEEKKEEQEPIKIEEKKEEQEPIQTEEKKEEQEPMQTEGKKEEQEPMQTEGKKEEQELIQTEGKKEEQEPMQMEEKKEEQVSMQMEEKKEEQEPTQIEEKKEEKREEQWQDSGNIKEEEKKEESVKEKSNEEAVVQGQWQGEHANQEEPKKETEENQEQEQKPMQTEKLSESNSGGGEESELESKSNTITLQTNLVDGGEEEMKSSDQNPVKEEENNTVTLEQKQEEETAFQEQQVTANQEKEADAQEENKDEDQKDQEVSDPGQSLDGEKATSERDDLQDILADVTGSEGVLQRNNEELRDPDEMEEFGDLVQGFTDLGSKFQDTAEKVAVHLRPDLQRLSDTSMVYFNKANQQIAESFLPLTGRQYAPFFAYIVSYVLLFLPLIVVFKLFEHIRALLSLQKVLLFINIYLAAYFLTLVFASLVLGSEPMTFFHRNALSGYIYLQILQALGYLVYLLLQSFNIANSWLSSSDTLAAKFSAMVQWLVSLLVGLHYYVTVFHPAMSTKAPRTNWKNYGIYSIAFSILCLFARVKRLKKEYIPLGEGDVDKKN